MLDIIVLFAIGLVFLIKASEYIVDSSIELAKILKISQLAIGFILLSVATSLPELLISSTASLSGNSGISIGNVIGANIADITWVLGVTAILGMIVFSRKTMVENAAVLLLVSIISLALVSQGTISRIDGFILLTIFLIYCYFVLKRGHSAEISHRNYTVKEAVKVTAMFCGSLAVVLASANLVVSNAAAIASFLNIPQSFIGLSIVSIGTTLPELTVSIAAIKRKKSTLAIGNILGSCVTNLTLVLGTAAVINPIVIKTILPFSSILFLLGVNFFVLIQLNKRGKLTKSEGAGMVLAYLVFLLFEAGAIGL